MVILRIKMDAFQGVGLHQLTRVALCLTINKVRPHVAQTQQAGKDAVDDLRRPAERGLVDADQTRDGQQRAPDCQHLLLIAREQPGRRGRAPNKCSQDSRHARP